MNARSLGIARSVAVIGGTGALILGATFAANIGTASLTGNTLSASAGLQVSLDDTAYGLTATGFDFGSMSPGGAGSEHKNFYLKNSSGGAIATTVKASGVTGFAHLDKTKVKVHIKKNGVAGDGDMATLQSLSTTDLPLTDSDANDTPGPQAGTKYDVWVTLDEGALTGGSVNNTGGFDLDFTGTTAP